MPAHPLPPGPWLRVIVYSNAENKPFQNDIWYIVSTGFTPPNMTNVANAWDTAVTSDWQNFLCQNANLIGYKFYFNNGTYTVSHTKYVNYGGSTLDDPAPDRLCIIVQLQCGIATRAANGRYFLSGFGVGAVDGDYINSGFVATAQALANAIQNVNTLDTLSVAHCVWSRKLGGLHTLPAVTVSNKFGGRRKRAPIF